MKTSLSLISLLAGTAAVRAADKAPRKEQPNVVLIMVDDMGYSDPGYYGSEIRKGDWKPVFNSDPVPRNGSSTTSLRIAPRCTT